MVRRRCSSLSRTRIRNNCRIIRSVPCAGPVQRNGNTEKQFLSLEKQTRQSVRQKKKSAFQHYSFLRISHEISVSRLSLAQCKNQAGYGTGHVRSLCSQCCRIAGIKSKSKHYSYKKTGEKGRIYPNILLSGLNIDGPLQCIVSDMTAFYVHGIYYELTLYMDLWNNELIAHALSAKRGDRMTYISGLNDVIELKSNIRNFIRFCIPIRGLYMHQKHLTNCFRCTA